MALGGACAPSGIPAYAPERAGAPTRHVIIISIDTLRSDRLPAYGYAKGSTPALDAFRRDGVLVEIPAEDLVPGDLLILAAGDRISADAELVTRTDASQITDPCYRAPTLDGPCQRVRPVAPSHTSISPHAGVLFQYTDDGDPDSTGSQFVAQTRTWFGSIWDTIARPAS